MLSQHSTHDYTDPDAQQSLPGTYTASLLREAVRGSRPEGTQADRQYPDSLETDIVVTTDLRSPFEDAGIARQGSAARTLPFTVYQVEVARIVIHDAGFEIQVC